MQDMTAIKSVLSAAYRIDQRLSAMTSRLESLRDLSTRVSAAVPGHLPGGRRVNDRAAEIVAAIADLEREIQAEVETLLGTQRQALALIKTAGRPEWQTVLELRYLCFKRWETIAEEMDVSLRQVYHLHKQALGACKNGHNG